MLHPAEIYTVSQKSIFSANVGELSNDTMARRCKKTEVGIIIQLNSHNTDIYVTAEHNTNR